MEKSLYYIYHVFFKLVCNNCPRRDVILQFVVRFDFSVENWFYIPRRGQFFSDILLENYVFCVEHNYVLFVIM